MLLVPRMLGPTVGLSAVALLGGCGSPPAPTSVAPMAVAEEPRARYQAAVARIETASREAAYPRRWLRTLCQDIGHRLSGSPALERAVDWAASTLARIDGVVVERQPVEVPRWVRGEESLVVIGEDGTEEPVPLLGLGMSPGTGPDGIEGELVVLTDVAELETRAEEVAGRVVLFDVPMPPFDEETERPGYGEVVGVRIGGPVRAGAYGALAVLLRSLTTDPTSPPHTGMTAFEGPEGRDPPHEVRSPLTREPRYIPAAAITIPDAERLHRRVDAGERVRVRLRMGARNGGTATSHNVIATLTGQGRPDELVVFGGHIDSWDVGDGCHDDGAGVVSAMAALRLLSELELRPRRTLRAVLWTNEENGLGGARAYAADHAGDGRHVAALESDSGAAPVIALQVEDPREDHAETSLEQIRFVADLLRPLGVRTGRASFSGADLGPLRELGVPGVGVTHDTRHYFDLHHTAADTYEAVDPEAFRQGVAVMAATAYVLAEAPWRLGERGD